MSEILNKLHERKLIFWHVPKRYDEKQSVGWLALKNLE